MLQIKELEKEPKSARGGLSGTIKDRKEDDNLLEKTE